VRLVVVALLIALVNLPFGYWRGGLRKFSLAWFVAVHAPVPLVAGLRIAVGVGLSATTFPLFVLAYLSGQYLGARLRARLNPVSSSRAGKLPQRSVPTHSAPARNRERAR
jgi:hypothetical protein